MHSILVNQHYFCFTVEPRYNDMSREQLNYIFTARYRYMETPDITILLQSNQKYRYIKVKGINGLKLRELLNG